MLHWLGKFAAKRPLIVFAFWVLALAGAATATFSGFGHGNLFDRLSSSMPGDPSSESARAHDLMSKNGGGQSLILRIDGDWSNAPSTFTDKLNSLLEGLPDEVTVVNPLVPPQEYLDAVTEEVEKQVTEAVTEEITEEITANVTSQFPAGTPQSYIDSAVKTALEANLQTQIDLALPEALSKANKDALDDAKKNYLNNIPELKDLTVADSAIIVVNSDRDFTEDELVKFGKDVENLSAPSLETSWSSDSLIQKQLSEQSSKDLESGEIISLPVALLVMLVIFGGFIAASMPLIGAGASIVSGLATLWAFSFFMDIDTTVMSIVTVIGLGVSIDYGLLFMSRYREFLRIDAPETKEEIYEVLGKTVNSAGRTILFSAATIAIAVAGLLAIPIPFMWSVAVSAASVVLLASFAVVTLLPAILSLFGLKLTRPSVLTKIPGFSALARNLGDVAPEEGLFSKTVRLIKKAPAIWLIASTLLLVVFGSSIATINVASSGTPYLANEVGAYGFYQKLQRDTPTFEQPSATIVLNSSEEFAEWESELEAMNVDYNHQEDSSTISVFEKNPLDLRELRDSDGLPGLITGPLAEDFDFNQALLQGLPWTVTIIVVATFVLLFLLSGSIFVPVNAILFSTLSLGASIGVLTWGFEGSGLSGILGFQEGSITGMSPIILVLSVVFGFGLAMDYSVFLIARMKEDRDRLLHEAEGASLTRKERRKLAQKAVSSGLQSTGRVITSAGLIIVLVFLGFAAGEMLMIKQIGVALAVAVTVDMILVRVVAVPAVMLLMGDAAWWAPQWMKKIQTRFGISH